MSHSPSSPMILRSTATGGAGKMENGAMTRGETREAILADMDREIAAAIRKAFRRLDAERPASRPRGERSPRPRD